MVLSRQNLLALTASGAEKWSPIIKSAHIKGD
jgi:hypothetical protein